MTDTPGEFGFDVAGFLSEEVVTVRADLESYFTLNTGRYFDQLSAESDSRKITATDIAALATLSVEPSGSVVAALLFERADELNQLLAECPAPDATIWGIEVADIADDSPLAKLYVALKSIDQINYVRASKLLSCKRPHLVPVRDTVVEKVLGSGVAFWIPMREVMSDPALREQLEACRPSYVDGVSLLRLLDVALWTHGKRLGY